MNKQYLYILNQNTKRQVLFNKEMFRYVYTLERLTKTSKENNNNIGDGSIILVYGTTWLGVYIVFERSSKSTYMHLKREHKHF